MLSTHIFVSKTYFLKKIKITKFDIYFYLLTIIFYVIAIPRASISGMPWNYFWVYSTTYKEDDEIDFQMDKHFSGFMEFIIKMRICVHFLLICAIPLIKLDISKNYSKFHQRELRSWGIKELSRRDSNGFIEAFYDVL